MMASATCPQCNNTGFRRTKPDHPAHQLCECTFMQSPEVEFLEEIHAELGRARAAHPGANLNLAALTEEVGELAQALLHNRTGERYKGWHNVRKEAIQVAAMAMRCALEGDASIAVPPAGEA